MVGGVIESVNGYKAFFMEELSKDGHPGLYLLKGLDLFLVHYDHIEDDLPSWLNIVNFKELKILLWETIIVTLVVFTLTYIATLKNSLKPDALILPGVIFILSISLYFVKKEDKH